jgi:outer membrane immunogenic protein
MRLVWRLRAARIGALLVALPLVLSSGNALAQSSLGAPLSNATGRSLTDAANQNQQELIDREVLGGSPAGRSTTSGSGGGATLNVFGTGRVRGSDHDALRPLNGDPSGANGPYPYDTREYSAFGNIVVTLPGTVLGGQMKVSGFVGENSVSLSLKSDSVHILDPNQAGKARNDSMIAGGTVLWSLQNTYALAMVVGSLGQSTLKDTVDDCGHPFGCNDNRYSFSTTGFIGSVTAGHVLDLAGKSGPKLDLRGSVGYTHSVGDTFTNISSDQQKYTFSTWTGTAGVTLFTNMALQNDALLRPYVMAYVRQEWGYKNELEAVRSDGLFLGNFFYEQKHLYGGVDGGLTYTQGNTTFAAAMYYEGSGSEHTLGGRLGVSQKLDGLAASGKTRSFNWSGFYAGVNAGGAWAESRVGTLATCLDIDAPPPALTCTPITPAQLPAVNAAGTGSLSDRGFTGGVQGGYNIQTGNFVFGLEIDAESFNLGASRSVTIPALATVTTAFDTNWLFTARARVGIPVAPNLLVYGTAGFGLTDLSVSNSITTIGAESNRGLVTGRVFGAGAEWALSRDWTLRAEYLYLDFGDVTVNAPKSISGAKLTDDYNEARTTADLTAQIVRLGLNHRF